MLVVHRDRVDVVSSGALVHDRRPDREAHEALAGAAVNASALHPSPHFFWHLGVLSFPSAHQAGRGGVRGAGGRRCQRQRRIFLKISGSSTVPRTVICCSTGRTGQRARHWRAPSSTPMRELFSTVQFTIKLQVASLCIVAGRTGRRARRWRALSLMPARAGRARCRPAPWARRSPRPPAPPSTRSRVCSSQPQKAPLVAIDWAHFITSVASRCQKLLGKGQRLPKT